MKTSPFMLRLIVLTKSARRSIRQLVGLSQTIPHLLKNRRQQFAREAAEAERLDRIRNPSDYLGK